MRLTNKVRAILSILSLDNKSDSYLKGQLEHFGFGSTSSIFIDLYNKEYDCTKDKTKMVSLHRTLSNMKENGLIDYYLELVFGRYNKYSDPLHWGNKIRIWHITGKALEQQLAISKARDNPKFNANLDNGYEENDKGDIII